MPGRRSGRNKRVTLAKLAERAGVSAATVSMVLNRPATSKASAQTRRRVLRAVRELGYDTDALRTSARKRLAALSGARVLMFIHASPGGKEFFEPSIDGFRDVTERFDIRLEIAFGADDLRDDGSMRRFVEARDIGGVLLAGMLPRTAEYLAQQQLPCVVLGDFFTPSTPCAQVKLNNFKGGYVAAHALVAKGHRRIGFVGYPEAGEFHCERMAGVLQRLLEAEPALDASWLMCAGGAAGETREAYLERAMSLARPPTAFVAASAGMCKILLDELERRGISVPGDVSVVSFDRPDSVSGWERRLTTIEYDMSAMGRLAMNKLVKLLNGTYDELTVELMFPKLVQRSSVRPPRTRKKAGKSRRRR